MFLFLKQPIQLVFLSSLLGLFLVVFGIVPREFIFLVAILLLGYMAIAKLNQAVLLFVRFIPFFFALPISYSFDNFNIWRIAIIILFLRWFLSSDKISTYINVIRNPFTQGRSFWKKYPAESLGLLLFAIAVISFVVSDDITAAVKRTIYFANMALLFVIVRDLVNKEEGYLVRLAQNFLISGVVATGIGYMQWISAYLLPAWQWHYWWGQIVSLGMYGKNWADIVTNFGNTWFNYSGGGLKLRMFSLFPDSHSFPLYLIMLIPSVFIAVKKRYLRNILLLFLSGALVLSGTRGIWISVVFPMVVFSMVWLLVPRVRTMLRPLLYIFAAFGAAFLLAWGILFIPQFQEDGVVSGRAFTSRMGSLFDFGETSNAGRIKIWQRTLVSIGEKPLLGVGIGNFPSILSQNISASKAGSSAHNIFLHIAAEMGILALIIFLWFFLAVAKRAFAHMNYFSFATILSLVWILGYGLTDAALFDERAFLGFMVFLGMILGVNMIKLKKA